MYHLLILIYTYFSDYEIVYDNKNYIIRVNNGYINKKYTFYYTYKELAYKNLFDEHVICEAEGSKIDLLISEIKTVFVKKFRKEKISKIILA